MRRVGRGLAVLGAVLVTVGATALSAQAVDSLELSRDGTHWSTSLPDQVFGTPRFVVPGDVISSALWVRNSSEFPTRVQLTVADDLGSASGRLAGDLSLAIDGVPTAGGDVWTGPALASGAVVRIPLVVTFSPSAQSGTRLDTASVLSTVSLVQIGPSTAPPSAQPAAQPAAPPAAPPAAKPAHTVHGDLARTGLDAARALATAVCAVGLGILLVVAAGRRSRRAQA